ncbi:unnamed protein product [Anisakis simplex]|uniref:Intraflagellar transport protein 52 C-terminal domain-containing protein n=1 Tax=Anisakis simplex TaxID=6269 RepID=A0A3P6SPG3_ANISI|nr:unnamed protein product [Anisakis simplex]
MDYFIREAGEIFGISRNLPINDRGPKRILEYVLHQEDEDEEQNLADATMELFEPALNQEDEPYFSDIDDYDDSE